MNNTNPIFEAMNCLDENYAAESVKPRKEKMKKPLRIAVIAAASVAALSLLAGFMSTSDRFRVRFFTKNSSEHGFYLDLKPHKYTIPDEYKSTLTDGHYCGFADMLPGELLEKFGLSILTSENFTDTKDVAYHRGDDGHTWEPYFDADEFKATFDYFLRDKKIGANVWFRAEYIADIDRIEISARYKLDENDTPEIITLNNGSPCMVSDTAAVFAYNGVGYRLWFDYGEEQSAELYKQALTDLGIYTPI